MDSSSWSTRSPYVIHECPKQAYHAVEKYSKVTELGPEVDHFGIVSGRALPEHYYANTGFWGATPNRDGKSRTTKSPSRSASSRRSGDRNAVTDFSHPKCYANPENNIRFMTIYDSRSAYLDTSLKSMAVIDNSNNLTASSGLFSTHNSVAHAHSRTIRFEADPRIIEVDVETGVSGASSHQEDTAPEGPTCRPTSTNVDGLFFGQRRTGVKAHNCLQHGRSHTTWLKSAWSMDVHIPPDLHYV